jgi:hypothetical protein
VKYFSIVLSVIDDSLTMGLHKLFL